MCGGSLAPHINLSEQVTETELFEFDFEFFEFDIELKYALVVILAQLHQGHLPADFLVHHLIQPLVLLKQHVLLLKQAVSL